MHKKNLVCPNKNILRLLHKSRMDFYSNGKFPYDVSKKLSKKDCRTFTQDRLNETLFLYASTVGSSVYVLMCTRLDLANTVGVLSKFQSNLGKSHWQGVKQVFHYLKCIKSYVLTYQVDELQLIRYSNFDYQGCLET